MIFAYIRVSQRMSFICVYVKQINNYFCAFEQIISCAFEQIALL